MINRCFMCGADITEADWCDFAKIRNEFIEVKETVKWDDKSKTYDCSTIIDKLAEKYNIDTDKEDIFLSIFEPEEFTNLNSALPGIGAVCKNCGIELYE